jgi:hypothetical protein
MFNFKNWIPAAASALLLTAAAIFAQQSAPTTTTTDTRRAFYLTRKNITGGSVSKACAAGYHMASAFEILDPTSLRYDKTLGRTAPDSGFGPPSVYANGSSVLTGGWVRTGSAASIDYIAGGNCNLWTSDDATEQGTAMALAMGNFGPTWLFLTQVQCDGTSQNGSFEIGDLCVQN